MSYRIHEKRSHCSPSLLLQVTRSRIRDQFMPDVDLDAAYLELFAQYITALEGIGVNIQDECLRDTLNAYPDHMEAALQAVLEYAQVLRQKHQDFLQQYHATNCLTKALREGWKPYSR